jgi:dienelactone hydrolase
MKYSSLTIFIISALYILFTSCGNSSTSAGNQAAVVDSASTTPSIKTADVIYPFNGSQSTGFIAFDQNRKGKLPIVVIVPEWWGLNDYVRNRAKQLAALGYFAIDADLFGGGKTAADPAQAMALTKPFYMNPALALPAVEAAAAKAATFSQADSTRVAAIGYCFGGFIVLNAAKLGAPLKGVVSFHGGLGGVQPKRDGTKADILVCQGQIDQFVPEPDRIAFKKSMDSAGAHYAFIEYPGATHAFTNPDATANGLKFKIPIAYNGAADSASWRDMNNFFLSIFK